VALLAVILGVALACGIFIGVLAMSEHQADAMRIIRIATWTGIGAGLAGALYGGIFDG
jgi:hypothetical protein